MTEPIAKKVWEDEDKSDDDIKDNWDDEDEPEAPASEAPKPAPAVSSKPKKLTAKIAEKERKEREAREARPKTTEEVLAEKLRQQQLQEESDLMLAKEAFGESNASNSGSGLDMSLNTREDFESFKKNLVDKLIPNDKSPHYVKFLENLFLELCVSIETDDIKRLSSSLTALFNEKVKAQKAGTKGKKKGKGVSVKVERNADYDVVGGNDLDDFDDFI